MTKSKKDVERLKVKADGWEPSQQDLDTIVNRLEITGQKGITHLDRDLYKKICREYREKHPEEDVKSVSYAYFTLVKYLRLIFKRERMEFFKWMSDPAWVFEVDFAVHDFLTTGKIEDKWLASSENEQGGFFKYTPDAIIELVEMSRGAGKTTKWSALRALHLVIQYPKFKWLVASGDKEKAKGLLKSIKEMMSFPGLSLIFPDMFSDDPTIFKSRKGNLLTNEKVDIVTLNEETEEKFASGKTNYEFRKEATFMVVSPGIDRTSFHFEGMVFDDLVNKETSASPEKTKELLEFFQSLFAMVQYRDGWKFRAYGTGTEWWENSLYSILEGWGNVTIFRCPARWKYGMETQRLCRHFTDEFLESQKTLLGEWYDNQMMMKPRPYSGEILDLGFSHDRNVVTMTEDELEELKANNLVLQICDPSYSAKGKTSGDKKSRFTILNAVVTEDKFYLYNGYQSYGKDISGVKATNTEIGKREDIDYFIQDAQGTQMNFFEEQVVQMKKELQYMRHKAHTIRITGGKQLAANSVLKELFLSGEMVVIKIKDDKNHTRVAMMQEFINQILGLSGLDFVDCAVYMVTDIDRTIDVNIARMRKNLKKQGTHTKLIRLSGNNRSGFRRLA